MEFGGEAEYGKSKKYRGERIENGFKGEVAEEGRIIRSEYEICRKP